MANYYCLIAGLPEINLTDAHPKCSMQDFVEQLHESLSGWDARLMADYFFLQKDCRNLVKLLRNPETDLDLEGNYSREQYLDLIEKADESGAPNKLYPEFMTNFVRNWSRNIETKGYFPEDDILFQFYDFVLTTCSNKFVCQWYRLNLDVNNILTAMLARKQGWNVADFVQGDGEVQRMIRENSSKDFNLSSEFDYFKELMQIVEQEDPVKKERMLDAFKWLWLTDNTFFTPFGIESVFAYMCKLEMQYRWANLDVEHGKARFQKIIDDLRGSAQVPDEYKRKGA